MYITFYGKCMHWGNELNKPQIYELREWHSDDISKTVLQMYVKLYCEGFWNCIKNVCKIL